MMRTTLIVSGCVFFYLFIAGVTVACFDDEYSGEATFSLFFWPVSLPIILGILIVNKIKRMSR